MQAATKLFILKGYNGTSIHSIMENVSLSKSAFYKHFKNKTDLLKQIMKENNSRYLEDLKNIINDYQEDAISKIYRIINFNALFGEKNIDIIIL